MKAIRALARTDWRVAVALLALTLCARALVPVGWMPDARSGITICTGNGVQQAWIDDAGKLHRGSPAAQHDHDPCAFSALGMGGGVADPNLSVEEPVRGPQATASPRPAVYGEPRLVAPPPPATGPPPAA